MRKNFLFSIFSSLGGFGLLVALVLSWTLVAGCPAPTSNEEATQDASTQETAPEKGGNCTAQPSNPCLQGCGNALGVGMPCTRGGGECNSNPKAQLCTGDFNQTTDLVYCTTPCVEDSQCGEGAFCQGDPNDPAAGRGCFPSTCGSPREPNPEPATEPTPESSPETIPEAGPTETTTE